MSTEYCQAVWEHYSGMAMCDCTGKAVKGTGFCVHHQGFQTETEMAYAKGRADMLAEVLEVVKAERKLRWKEPNTLPFRRTGDRVLSLLLTKLRKLERRGGK